MTDEETRQPEYFIEVDPSVNTWTAEHKRFYPGRYVTTNRRIAEAGMQARNGISVRELFPGEVPDNLGRFEDDPTLTTGPLTTKDMAGGNNLRQSERKIKTAEEAQDATRVEKAWDYSRDPGLSPEYIPHSERAENLAPAGTAEAEASEAEAEAEAAEAATQEATAVAEFDEATAVDEAPPVGVEV